MNQTWNIKIAIGHLESDFVWQNCKWWQVTIFTLPNCKFHTTCRNYLSKIHNWHSCHIVVLNWLVFFSLGSLCFTGIGYTKDFLVKKCIHHASCWWIRREIQWERFISKCLYKASRGVNLPLWVCVFAWIGKLFHILAIKGGILWGHWLKDFKKTLKK